MKLENIKIKNIIPHKMNPRKHPNSAIEKLEKSIKAYGWTNPILLSKDGILLAGHARLKAAKKAGLKEVPAIYLDLEGAEADAYLIADNKIQDETLWDFPVLKDLIEELDTGVLSDISITGFDEYEIEEMMTRTFEPRDDDHEEDIEHKQEGDKEHKKRIEIYIPSNILEKVDEYQKEKNIPTRIGTIIELLKKGLKN